MDDLKALKWEVIRRYIYAGVGVLVIGIGSLIAICNFRQAKMAERTYDHAKKEMAKTSDYTKQEFKYIKHQNGVTIIPQNP